MFFILLFSAALLVSIIWGAAIYNRLSGWHWLDRLAAALVPAAALCLIFLLVHKTLNSIYYDQNWIRLQRTFVLAYGFPLYGGLNSGAAINAIYGPVSSLAYLPAALFRTPARAMMTAEIVGMCFFFLPALWLHLGQNRHDPKILIYALAGFFSFSFFPFMVSSLRAAAFNIHADAPALGLGALACALLLFRKKNNELLWLLASAVSAALAVWSKQVAAPLCVALPLYLWLADGPRVALKYFACIAVWGLAVSGVFVLVFGYENLFFNMITIPSRHAFEGKYGMDPMSFALYKLLRECSIILIVGIFSFFVPVADLFRSKKRWREWFRENPWTLPLLVSLLMVPTSLLGKAKEGGSNNTLCYTTYFLAIASTMAFISAIKNISYPAWFTKIDAARRMANFTLIVFLLIQVPCIYYKYTVPAKEDDYAQMVFEYLKKYPGETYFPRLTVLHLMAENKIYHDSVALNDRIWADLPLSDTHMRAYIPQNLKQIGFRENKEDDRQWLRLPEFTTKAKDEKLPGYFVYRKAQ